MRKIETIWHHLLWKAIEKKVFKHTQAEIASYFDYSLSTVHHALATPSEIGAIRKETKFFVLENVEKLLYFWASLRNLERDIIYTTYVDNEVGEIEGLVPPEVIYGAYSAGRRLLGEPPADYSKVYLYLKEEHLSKVKTRFPYNPDHPPNLFILKAPAFLSQYGPITTYPHTFVDIWNLRDWYSRDFTLALEEKIHELLS